MIKFWTVILALGILSLTFGFFEVIQFFFLILGVSFLLFFLTLAGLIAWLIRRKRRHIRKRTIEVDGEQVEAEFQNPDKRI
jgi:uncharacterized membrane protein YkvI